MMKLVLSIFPNDRVLIKPSAKESSRSFDWIEHFSQESNGETLQEISYGNVPLLYLFTYTCIGLLVFLHGPVFTYWNIIF